MSTAEHEQVRPRSRPATTISSAHNQLLANEGNNGQESKSNSFLDNNNGVPDNEKRSSLSVEERAKAKELISKNLRLSIPQISAHPMFKAMNEQAAISSKAATLLAMPSSSSSSSTSSSMDQSNNNNNKKDNRASRSLLFSTPMAMEAVNQKPAPNNKAATLLAMPLPAPPSAAPLPQKPVSTFFTPPQQPKTVKPSSSSFPSPSRPNVVNIHEDLIVDRDAENLVARLSAVKIWNQKKRKQLGLEGRSEMKTDTVFVSLEKNGKKIGKMYSLDLTPLDIKTKILEEAGIAESGDGYELRIAVVKYVITALNLPLRRQTFVQACNISYITPHFEVVPKEDTGIPTSLDSVVDLEKLDVKKHIQTELEIFELVGPSLSRTLDAHKPEVRSFRKTLARLRGEVLRARTQMQDTELQQFIYSEGEPLPLVVPSKVFILAQLPGDTSIRKRIDVDPQLVVEEIRNQVFQKFSMIDKVNSNGKFPDMYVLKVTGYSEYLVNNVQVSGEKRLSAHMDGFKLLDYDYIRKCISKKQQIILSLVEASELSEQISEVVEDSIIDKLLEADEEIKQEEDSPFPTIQNTPSLPITKVNRQFRFKIVGIRDLNLSREEIRVKFPDKPPLVYVLAEIHEGGQLIATPAFTPLSPVYETEEKYSNWDLYLLFDIQLRNLPKAARLCMTLYACPDNGNFNTPTEIGSKGNLCFIWLLFALVS
jgi:hypothetical protein